jgi:hypothetical protein
MGEHARLRISSVTSTSDGSIYLISNTQLFEGSSPPIGHQDRRLTRGTVNTTMTTSPVRVDAGVEADVGAAVRGDDGAGVVAQVDGLGAGLVLRFGGVRLHPDLREAVLRVGGGAPAGDAPRSVAVRHRRILPAAGRLTTAFSSPNGSWASKSGRILSRRLSGPGDLGQRPRGGSVRMDPYRQLRGTRPGAWPASACLRVWDRPW